MTTETALHIVRAWGKAIEIARVKAGLTQIELARVVRSSQAAISRIERGVQEPSLELRLAIAEALDTPHDDLFPVSAGAAS